MRDSGGTGAPFPMTPISAFAKLRDGKDGRYDAHLEWLCRLYWKPVYAFVRRTWSLPREEAMDRTQEFFAWTFENKTFVRFDPARGNFRSFVKTVLTNFLRDGHRRDTARKRGGQVAFVPIPSDGSDPDTQAASLSPDEAFDRNWSDQVMAHALERLKDELNAQGQSSWFEALRLYDLDPSGPSYQDIAQRLGVKENDVRNYLHRARVRLREILIEHVSEYIGTEEEILEEMRAFLSVR